LSTQIKHNLLYKYLPSIIYNIDIICNMYNLEFRSYTMDGATAYYFVADISEKYPNYVINVRICDATPHIIIHIGYNR